MSTATKLAVSIAFLGFSIPVRAQEPRALSLTEAFGLAEKRSEELARRGLGVSEVDARIRELWSAVKPSLSLKGSEFLQDASAQGGALGSFTQKERPEAKVSLRQPLFAGLREFLAVKAARAQRASVEAELARARDLLYLDTAGAYLDLLWMRRQIVMRKSMVAVTQDRVSELKAREKLGRSRKSEVLAAESQLAQLEAQVQETLREERSFQETMRFLTGLSGDIAPEEVALPAEESAEPYLAAAARRPDVEARRRDAQAAAFLEESAARAYWPTVGLDGNYYLRRTGLQGPIKWDLLLSAELPLYTGGATGARTEQAHLRRSSGEEALSLALRRAESEVRNAHQDLSSYLSVVRALEKALSLAEANASAQAEDYRLGLVTNLDVLGSLNSLGEMRLKLNSARLDASYAAARLTVAAGKVR